MNKLLQLIFFALDKMDSKLAYHSRRVASLGGHLAELTNQDPKFIKKVYIAGLLHDIGFLKMSVNFNEKPRHQMNEAEHQYVDTHSDEGVSLINGLVNSQVILNGIRYHHEMYDGSGKPLGLKKEDIPLVARILAVADIYDSLLVGEMFGDVKNTPAYAREQLIDFSGNLTDPDITDCLLNLLDDNFVFYAPRGLHEDLIYPVCKLKTGPLTSGDLISHNGTVLVRKGTEITQHQQDKIKNEYPGQKFIIPASEAAVEAEHNEMFVAH